jgi:hypothetical protein
MGTCCAYGHTAAFSTAANCQHGRTNYTSPPRKGTTIFFQIVASFFVCNLFLDSHVFSFFTNLSDWHFQHQFGRKFVVRFGSKTVSASAGK